MVSTVSLMHRTWIPRWTWMYPFEIEQNIKRYPENCGWYKSRRLLVIGNLIRHRDKKSCTVFIPGTDIIVAMAIMIVKCIDKNWSKVRSAMFNYVRYSEHWYLLLITGTDLNTSKWPKLLIIPWAGVLKSTSMTSLQTTDKDKKKNWWRMQTESVI